MGIAVNYLAAGAVGYYHIFEDDHADIIELWDAGADQGVGLVDEDDLHRAEVTGRTAGLGHLNTGPLMEFLRRENKFFFSKYFLKAHVENLRSGLGEESWPDEVGAAAAAAEAEEETAGGEDEVPAQLLEVHLDLVNTAGLVLLLLLLRADIPGPSAVSFVKLVAGQFLLASPS